MKVAIMGAGLSGLACAITLEKYGIYPTIFEKRSRAGDRFVNAEIFLSILNKPVYDAIAFLGDQYGIYLQPTSHIHSLVLYSERQKAEIQGHLGFCNLRGRDKKSFENQLSRQVKSQIIYNSKYTYEQLAQDFTHVVMATGDADYAVKMENFRTDYASTLNGYNVSGDFNRYTIRVWMNNRIIPDGYGYLVPVSEKEANIVIWYPKYPRQPDLNYQALLENFLQTVSAELQQNFTILEHFEINDYQIGICQNPRIGNTYFTGNCFGSITPYLGFGQFVAILTGIYAALDICGTHQYSNLTKPLRQNYENSLVLRKAWERFDNRQFDRMVNFFGSPLGNKLFTSGHFDVVKLASYLARPWIRKRKTIL
ncbi:MAG TPA: dehydrogenase [Firmicutes bacterium]|nr:dehydrogenase [Bacillota bacterium]